MAGKTQELADLKKQSEREDIWHDQEEARAVMQRLNALSEQVTFWKRFDHDLADYKELLKLAADDPKQQAEVIEKLETLAADFTKHESEALLSDEHDAYPAILTIKRALAAPTPKTGHRCWSECTCALPSAANGRLKLLTVRPGKKPGLRASRFASTVITPTAT